VGGPVIDNEIGWRAAVMYEKRDGWVRSVVPGVEPLNGVDAVAGRLTLLAKPNDSLTAQLKISQAAQGARPTARTRSINDPSLTLSNDPNFSLFTGNIGWFDNGAKFAVHKDIRSDNATLKIDWQLSPHATLTSVTGYDYGWWYEKSDDGGLPIFLRLDDPNTYVSSVNTFSQEIRIASTTRGLSAGSVDSTTGARARTRRSSSTSLTVTRASSPRRSRRPARASPRRCGDSMSTTTSISSRTAGPCSSMPLVP